MIPFSRQVCARRLSDAGCAGCGGPGLVEGTAVGVGDGWRMAEALEHHDRLRVFPRGEMRPVRLWSEEIWVDPLDCPDVVRPLVVPPGALGNDSTFRLQQDMRVMLRDRAARAAFGSDLVTIRAGNLKDFRGIALERQPPKRARLIHLDFDTEQVIEIAGGAWLLCPTETGGMAALLRGGAAVSVIAGRRVRHLTGDEADVFLAAQEARDTEERARN